MKNNLNLKTNEKLFYQILANAALRTAVHDRGTWSQSMPVFDTYALVPLVTKQSYVVRSRSEESISQINGNFPGFCISGF